MNQNYYRLLRFQDSGLSCGLMVLVALLLGSAGLGWLVNGLLVVFAVLLIVPLLVWWGLRWWLQRNLVEGDCPVCGYEFTGFNGVPCGCPSCGESLSVQGGEFVRLAPPGTIDVEAVEVSGSGVED